ncbi:MAG TPA: hypothetical protein VGK90_05885 [Rhizomicrobium sp.]
MLYAFCSQVDCIDGEYPRAGLHIDTDGDLFGTTAEGGTGDLCDNADPGCGTLFELTSNGAELVTSFAGEANGQYPYDGVISSEGHLEGTAAAGGDPICNCGMVFTAKRPK